MILGIDEVGRGPWAGPLVVGAVILPNNHDIKGLTDSKKLTAKKREQLNVEILEKALVSSLGWVSAEEIDRINLSKALKLATLRAVEKIDISYDQIIIDGMVNFLMDTRFNKNVSVLKKADLLVPEVSAASIIAKVTRDNFMIEQSKVYPEYSFDTNAGYGTKAHRDAIEIHGVTPLHRLSFSPLNKYSDVDWKSGTDTSKSRGDKAEKLVAAYLINNNHTILVKNFKTKTCEIDIVSKKGNSIYFTEVKYRKNNDFGGATQAIDSAKKKQMKYAAEVFMNQVKAHDKSIYQPILAAGFVGSDYVVEDWFTIY